jgi:hypothetical protein
MTALQWIVKEAKKIKKEYPKRFAKWTDYVAQASAIYAKKHKGHSPVGKKKAKVGYSKLRLKTDKELTKTIKNQPKELFPYTKKQELIRAGKKYFDDMAKNIHKVSGVKNKKVKKSPARSLHKDTKSHNVNIRVMSGIGNIGENFTRVNNDVYGNPRYVVHFLDVINTEERISIPFHKLYEYAVKKAKKIGGKKFDNKSYGGGIVFQSYNIENTWHKIQELKHTHPKIKI